MTIAVWVTVIAGLALVLWLMRAAYVVLFRHEAWEFPWSLNPDTHCSSIGVSCGVFTGFITPLLYLAFGSAVFLLWRFAFVKRRYVKKAKRTPRDLVQTAGTLIGDEVVGRDDLCLAIMANLRDRDGRRVHILIGGVGTGKTATLVQLTGMLAEQRAVPVPVRLRDADDDRLDFEELARTHFLNEIDLFLAPPGQGEKVWRQLRKDENVVVIADGLEEALPNNEDRDNLIRIAIRRANEQKLPVVIASRPHDPLRGSGAAIVELEPLSEEAALAYLDDNDGRDLDLLSWIVKTADVSAVPIYLQIARQLREKRLLRYVTQRERHALDPRGRDQSGLRRHLLDTWMIALFEGHFHGDKPLSEEDRIAAVERLSELACIGLKNDALSVKFDVLGGQTDGQRDAGGNTTEVPSALRKEVDRRLEALGRKHGMDARLAAAIGVQLGLVEAQKDGVRFLHSVMQAYLGSRLIELAILDPKFLHEALLDPGSAGREFLIALVLSSRGQSAEASAHMPSSAPADNVLPAEPPEPASEFAAPEPTPAAAQEHGHVGLAERSSQTVCDQLVLAAGQAAQRFNDVKAFHIYAAALEIDSLAEAPQHSSIASDLERDWKGLREATEPRTLTEAQLGLVKAFAAAARKLSERRRNGRELEESALRPAYDTLFRIGYERSSARRLPYAVRHAVALEVGVGGDDAFDQLHEEISPARYQRAHLRNAQGPDGQGSGAVTGSPPEDEQRLGAPEGARRDLTQEQKRREAERQRQEEEQWHREIMSAWVSPQLVASVWENRERARGSLSSWVELAGDRRDGSAQIGISMQIALAQGFKYAANRAPGHPDSDPDTRAFLGEQAVELLKRTGFWYAQLTLLHALCLFSLSDDVTRYPRAGGTRRSGHEHGAHPRRLVDTWLDLAGAGMTSGHSGGEQPRRAAHPLVEEAGRLAIRALESQQAERFVWIDESGVVGKIGSRPARQVHRHKPQLWIPPSTGWAALTPDAQKLVADVLLLLRLAERGDTPRDCERRLEKANLTELPPCLKTDRRPLDPTRTVAGPKLSEPGTNCMDGCSFHLCPYPPKDVRSYGVEFSEAFCRRQQILLRRKPLRKTARWQETLRGDLRRFWEEMAERARR